MSIVTTRNRGPSSNDIGIGVNMGVVTTTDETIKGVIIPCDMVWEEVAVFADTQGAYIGSAVFAGKGTKLALMRDVLVGPFNAGSQLPTNQAVERVVPLGEYIQVNAISLGADTTHLASSRLNTSPFDLHLWEPFSLDPADATVDFGVFTDPGCTAEQELTVVVDDGKGLHIDTDADDQHAYITKTVPTIGIGNGEDLFLRCFIQVDHTGSVVTTTTISSTIDSNSPIICGARNGTNYGVQLRLRGTTGPTFQIDFNYPTGDASVGTISGTTNLVDDEWYMAEGIIRKGTPGSQVVELKTYLLASDGTVGSAVSEGIAEDADTGGGKILTSTGKWGDHDGATGTSQINFYVDQVMMVRLT